MEKQSNHGSKYAPMIAKIRKHCSGRLADGAGYLNHWAPTFSLAPNNHFLLIAHRGRTLHVTNPLILWDIFGVLQ